MKRWGGKSEDEGEEGYEEEEEEEGGEGRSTEGSGEVEGAVRSRKRVWGLWRGCGRKRTRRRKRKEVQSPIKISH